MIVVDASVVVDYLLEPRGHAGTRLGRELRRSSMVAAPHLLDAEVGHVLRRLVLGGRQTPEVAMARMRVLAQLPIRRHDHRMLVQPAMRHLHNASFYDALYLALAEVLECPLLTADRHLTRVPEVRAQVEVIEARP